MLIAQNDDGELLEWLCNADQTGGGFIGALARAALVADWENYPLLRPVLVEMRKKYPKYEATDEVKAEIKARGQHSPNVTDTVAYLMATRDDTRKNED
jgi:hypothetical protein